ncbi:hypothetical protein [Roseomonas populi]|uniref:Cellulase Ig-like domain-containing protein n=1 Tax=Roseomonas populi TaxID=3121582 RepID=A0ABT1XAH6_9PROT|nr:hypothetical protein [Roseomonas pecuniae]MCR0985110.1 hypothetical protein [Roseomonas pecuniae]
MMRRRHLLATAAACAAPAGAMAQVRAAAPACPSQRGDVVGLVLEGTGGPAGAVAVFGQAFRPGDVPDAGAGRAALRARLPDGRPVPVQVDVKARHPDGSARWAVVALSCPALPRGSRQGVVLSAAAEAAGPAMDTAAALSGRQAVVTVRGAGGAEWRLDLLPAFRAALAEAPWQAGPLAVAARISAAVSPAAAGGVASLRLVADVALRADGALWVEAWFRNDVAMRPNGGEAAYAAQLVLDGRTALEVTIPRQFQYTGWGRLVGSVRAGTAPWVRHDAAYLADAAAVARYDLSTGVDEAVLARMGQAVTTPAWAAPLTARGIAQDMGQTGGRPDIGPATMPQAAWLITGDPRAAAYALGQAEAAGSIPWHYWDPSGGAGSGGWIDTRRWPRLWSDGRGGPAPGGLMQPVAGDTGWRADCAHQPDLNFVPYLLTGRRALLDNLQAQASWCVVSQWPAPAARGAAGAAGPGEGVNVVRGNQVRGAAWSLRQLENAAWVSPDADPNRPWLRAAAAGNWAWIRAQIPAWTAAQGEAHGWIPGEYGSAGVLPPWQQDYFASTAAIAARRGDEAARAVLTWMANFLVGRFAAADRGFTRNDGAAYLIANLSSGGQPLGSWAAIGEATRARGLSNGNGWGKSEGDYVQLAMASLAAVSDALGSEKAAQAYGWLAGTGAPFTRAQDFARDPVFHIVPRGRAGARCAP